MNQNAPRILNIEVSCQLKAAIVQQSMESHEDFLVSTSKWVKAGFEEMDDRWSRESEIALVKEFEQDLLLWPSKETETWSFTMDANTSVRICMTAKNFGKSRTEFAALCLAHAFRKRLK